MIKRLHALYHAHREAITYIFFGALTTVVSIVSYALLAGLFGRVLSPTAAMNAANFISLVLSVTFAYATNRRYVFESRACGRARWAEIASFFAGRALTSALDMALLNLLVGVMGLWDLAAKAVVTVVVIVLNFLIAKCLVFRRARTSKGRQNADA